MNELKKFELISKQLGYNKCLQDITDLLIYKKIITDELIDCFRALMQKYESENNHEPL